MSRTNGSALSLHYEDLGSGDPVIFLPGALGTGRSDFPEQLAAFSQKYRVIAPDLRGYGQSRPPARDYPADFYQRDSEDIFHLIQTLNLPTVRLVGWSDGANVAMLLAANHPNSVTQLVAFAGNSFISDQEIAAFRAMRSLDTWSPRALAPLEQIYGDDLASLWSIYVTGLERMHAAGGNIYRDRLAEITASSFILHGDKDPLVPAFHPTLLAERIPAARLHRFPDGKHNIHLKYAAEFNSLVFDFFANPKRSLAH
jgi:valacyclovir hydrolase